MLEEKILNDYKESMKAKDALKTSVLNFLRAELINVAFTKNKKALDDTEAIAVIRKQMKARQDSIDAFTKGGRMDLADKETKELAILKSYLPEELPDEQVKKIIEEVILVLNAQGMKDMGKVMKEAGAKIAGRADAKLVSDLVRARLAGGAK